jgi:hypothetical protein
MRPKKENEKLKGIIMQVRVTAAEADQFRAQAMARKMAASAYLRYLLLADADALSMEGKLRRGPDGEWEIFSMGEWRAPEE